MGAEGDAIKEVQHLLRDIVRYCEAGRAVRAGLNPYYYFTTTSSHG
jgi:hypothetical protein